MGQFSKVVLAIDTAHAVPQRVQDCRPGFGGLNQVYGPNRPNPFMGRVGDYNILLSGGQHE